MQRQRHAGGREWVGQEEGAVFLGCGEQAAKVTASDTTAR